MNFAGAPSPFLELIFQVLKHSSYQFLCFFGLIFAAGLVLTWISRWTNNSFRQFKFPQLGLYLFGIVGIPIHELSHALFAKLFFHEIESVKWFDPAGRDGSHGTVVHYYNDRNWIHRIGLLFIGLGPVLLAPVFLSLIYRWLVPGATSLSSVSQNPSHAIGIFTLSIVKAQNWTSWGFYLFLYLAVCLTSQMELSPDDMKIARGGILPAFALFLLINSIAALLNVDIHTRLMIWLQSGLTLWFACFFVAVLIALLNLIVCFLFLNLLNRLLGSGKINPFES